MIQQQKTKRKKKGVTMIIVVIISTCIALIMASTCLIASNYNFSILRKESSLKRALNNDGFYGVKVYIDSDE